MENTPKTVKPVPADKDSGAAEKKKDDADPNARLLKDYGTNKSAPKFFTSSPTAMTLTQIGRILAQVFPGRVPSTEISSIRYRKSGEQSFILSYNGYEGEVTNEDAAGNTQPPCFENVDALIAALRSYGALPGKAPAPVMGVENAEPEPESE